MLVSEVDPNDRRQVSAFVDLPFDLYRDCPQWVPPLVSEMRMIFDRRRYPYYRHSEAAFLVARSDGDTLGRIAVLDNRRYNDYHKSRTAFFYFFDCVDDGQVSAALFERGFAWARARGLDRMVGPKGMMRADGLGLLIEGFEHRPAMGIPYNYAYYAWLVEAAGFEKEVDYQSALLRGDYRLPERFGRIAQQVKERRGFRIKTFTSQAELRAWVPAIQKVNNESFTNVWGYYPLEDDDLQAIADRFGAIADPQLIKVVLKDEEVVGFLLAFPDLSEGLQKARGRLWPLGWWHILRSKRRSRWINFNGLGLLPRHQGVGANTLLYTEVQASIVARGADFADLVQIAETNIKSMGEITAIGAEWYKRHRIYRREL